MAFKRYWYRKNKFNAEKQKYNGRTYHSKMEACNAMWLDSLLREGKIKEIKPQSKLSIDINGSHICNMFVDFLVTLNDDRQKYVEIKGYPTDLWHMQKKLALVLSPIPYLVNPSERELLE